MSVSPATPAGRTRYTHIDAMRAYAVVVVVVAHAGLGGIVPGGSGVTIFFAISGFIITHLVLKERQRTGSFAVRGFYFRRAAKLGPPFLVIVLVPLIIYAFFRHVIIVRLLSQVFFFFNWVYMYKGDAGVLPGTGVVWSLAIEEQFYIAYALLCLVMIRGRHYRRALTALALVGAVGPLVLRVVMGLIASAHHYQYAGTDLHHRVYYGTDTRIDGIALGILAALAFDAMQQGRLAPLRRVFGSDWLAIGAVILYLITLAYRDLFFRETLRYTIQAAASAAVILYGFVGSSRLWSLFIRFAEWRPVQLIGLASYSIYLCHLPIVRGYLSLTGRADPQGWAIPILVAVGVVLGLLCWQFVERPVAAWKTRVSQGGSSALVTTEASGAGRV